MLYGRLGRILHVVSVGCVMAALSVVCGSAQAEVMRWDQVMIREAAIWGPLLRPYWGNGLLLSPVPTAGAEHVLTEYPQSRWTNDAKLMLAGGAATTEGGLPRALEILDSIDASSSEDTIVLGWNRRSGCRVDEVLMMNVVSLVYLNPDGTVRMTKPYDKDGPIPQDRQEVLAYFQHLKRYPRKAVIVSRLMAAQMHAGANQSDKAITMLEALIRDVRPSIAAMAAADRAASAAKDGYHLRCLWRPEYEAWHTLAWIVNKTDPGRSADLMVELATLVSPGGGHWLANDIVGDFLMKAGRKAAATAQYQLSINGLREDIADDRVRETKLGPVFMPPGVERAPTPLQQKLQEVQTKRSQ